LCLCAVLQRPSVWVSACCCFCIWLAAAVVPLGTNFLNLFWQVRTWTGGFFCKNKIKPFSVGYILEDQSFLHGVKIPPFLLKRMNVYDTCRVPNECFPGITWIFGLEKHNDYRIH
jgi:hypothetical protein